MIQPKEFMSYSLQGITSWLDLYGHKQYLQIAYAKMVEPMAFTKYLNEGIAYILKFVEVVHYPFKCQNEYDSTQGIYELPTIGYCKWIRSFWA